LAPFTRQRLGDSLDMLGERRRDMCLAFARQLHSLVARRVRNDLVVVEHHREVVARLLDRLALVAGAGELGNFSS
jgi:hypothetical protein